MKTTPWQWCLWAFLTIVAPVLVLGAERPWEGGSPYKRSVLTEMLREANHLNGRLGLNERRPLKEEDICGAHVTDQIIAQGFGALGSFRTSEFSYGFGKGSKLTYLTRLQTNPEKSVYERNKQFAISPAQVDTNGAFQLAKQYLARASVDVQCLNEKAPSRITAVQILDMTTSKYVIEWKTDRKLFAEVHLVYPQDILFVLRIEVPECIDRPPLRVEFESERVEPDKSRPEEGRVEPKPTPLRSCVIANTAY